MSMTLGISGKRVFFELWPEPLPRVMAAFGVRSWNDLANLSAPDLMRAEGFGSSHLRFVLDELSRVGLSLHGPIRMRSESIALPSDSKPLSGIYFIGCESFVKIGRAADIRRRLAAFQTAMPFSLTLLGYIPSASTNQLGLEKQLHRQFARLHHRGEWFRYEDPLVSFIDGLSSANGH